jgi:hypothetical protein
MDLGFGDFLSRLDGEVNSSRRKIQEDYDLPENDNEDIDAYEESEPIRRQPRKREEPQELPEDNEDDDYQQEEEPEDNTMRIDEEFRDKAYDYAQGVIKVIRNNFNTKEERIVMLESVYKAIIRYLDDIGSPIVESAPTYVPQLTPRAPTAATPATAAATPAFDRFNPDPTQFEGQEVQLQRPAPMRLHEGDYNPSLNLGVKVNANGQTEADLSKITNKDLQDMKVLMGIGQEQING